MNKARAVQRLVHTADNIGGRDLPHAIIHAQDALKAKTLPEAKDHIKRVMGHLKEASNQSGMQHEVIPMVVPGAAREAKRLAVEQTKSDGLVQDKKRPNPVVRKLKARSKASSKKAS